MRLLLIFLALFPCVPLSAGPYHGAANQPGSNAISESDSNIVGWATGWKDYIVGTECNAQWQTPEKALGEATGDSSDIVCLGRGGEITLTFDVVVTNGPGPDFAIFENSFSDTFLELAWVEVSSDGENFFRFDNSSLTASPVASFGSVDPTNLDGFAGKYRKGYGTPFDIDDLADHPDLDKKMIRFVKIIDIVGDGSALDSDGNIIYDPYPTAGSAGFDLDAVSVLHGIWNWFRLPDLPEIGTEVEFSHTPQLDVLPDGRFFYVHGQFKSLPETRIWTQNNWGEPDVSEWEGQQAVNPSFVAVYDENYAIIGSGGNFGELTDIWRFDPSAPSAPSGPEWESIAEMQNFAGSYWKNPGSATEGWLIVGTNGSTGKNSLSYVSLDGSTNKVIVDEISDFSSGIAIGPNGDVFVAGFTLGSPPEPCFRFSAAMIEGAISGSPLTSASGEFVFAFDSAGGLAVDAKGRIWAGGFASDGYLQMHDPSTGGIVRVKPKHPPMEEAGSVLYSPKPFSRNGVDYIGWTVRDAYDLTPEYYFGYGTIGHHEAPPITGWRHTFFGDDSFDSDLEGSLWGDAADGDSDTLNVLLEYALKTDPTKFTKTSDAYTVTVDPSGLDISFLRDPRHTDINLVVEVSNTLSDEVTWDEIARSSAGGETMLSEIGAGSVSEQPEGDSIRVVVRDPVPVGTVDARFARIRATRN